MVADKGRMSTTIIDCFVADIRHNLMRVNPLTGEYIGLTEEAIKRFETIVFKDEDRDVRIHGKFRYLSGRVWKTWDRIVHLVDRKMWKEGERSVIINGQPPQKWPRMFLIDPHDQKPHALLWIAKDPNYLLYYCYREAWLVNKTFSEAVRYIRDVEIANRDRIQWRIIDPNFGPKTQGNTKTTVREDFEREARNIGFPMTFTYGDDHAALGRKRVAEMLAFDTTKPISIINRPSLYVCNDLNQCIYQIEHHIWPDKDSADPDPMLERPVKKDDDFPACLRYFALFNWPNKPAQIIQGVGNFYA